MFQYGLEKIPSLENLSLNSTLWGGMIRVKLLSKTSKVRVR